MRCSLAVLGCVLLPALVVAGAYHAFLGDRSDYLGHYMAGCGATLVAVAAVLAVMPSGSRDRLQPLAVLIVTVCAIGLGAVLEATIYRIAKFDEVDFCNQSLGALLAGLGILAALGGRRGDAAALVLTLTLGLGLLAGGYHFAFR